LLPAPTLLMLLALQPAVSYQQPIEDQRIEAFRLAKNWEGLVDYMESLTPKQRINRVYAWQEGLEKSRRWARLLEVCEDEARRNKGVADPLLTHCKGRALSELGRHSEALVWFWNAGKRGETAGYLEALHEAVALADWKALQGVAEALVEKFPTNGVYLGVLGEALAKQGRFQEAEAPLNEAVHLTPKRAMSWADLACCYNERAENARAHEAASQAVLQDPRLMEGWSNRGRACMGLKRYKEGREDYAAALALGPKDPAVVENLARNIAEADRYLAYLRALPAKRPAKKP